MFKHEEQVKWVKFQMVGVIKEIFYYVGEELLFCVVTDQATIDSGMKYFIAPPNQCISWLGPENKPRPTKPILEIDFKPTEGVKYKTRG